MATAAPVRPLGIEPSAPSAEPRPTRPAHDGLSLRRNVVVTMTGWVAYTLCQWGVLVLLARWGSPESVGRFGLALGVTTPLMMFCGMQLRPVMASDQRDAYGLADYLWLRAGGTVVAVMATAAVAIAMNVDRWLLLVVVAMGVAKGVEAIGDIFLGVFQRCERMDRFSRALLLRGVATIAAFAAVYAPTGSLLAGVVAMASSWALCVALHDAPSAVALWRRTGRVAGRATSWRQLSLLARHAAPLAFVAGLMSLSANLPRYFVYESLGEAALGRFTALAYLVVAAQVIVASVSQSALPRLARHLDAGEVTRARRLVYKLFVAATLFGAGCTGVAFAWGDRLLGVIFDASYAPYGQELGLLGAAATMMFGAHAWETSVRAQQRFRPLLLVYVCYATALGVGCSWLVPAHGVRGAAMALLAAEATHLLVAWLVADVFQRPAASPSCPVTVDERDL